MSVHLRPLTRCQWYGCDRPATQELYNAVNAPSGCYCDRHAQMALRDFIKKYGADR